jgi:uncharacterized protein YbjQ (UPF0145 family)
VWDCDFRVEINDDSTLQDEPLELRVFDFDVVTSNDIIGSALIDLNPLLMADATTTITGWFPIYDSFRGICGELHAAVKVQYLYDSNPFREASAGLPLYSGSVAPGGKRIAHVASFVEELVVEADPEYHWSDPFRTMRSSNEERQLVLARLSARVLRLIGRKAMDAGANAVLGVRCALDLDAECVVARAYGTAVRLVKDRPVSTPPLSGSPMMTPTSLSKPLSLPALPPLSLTAPAPPVPPPSPGPGVGIPGAATPSGATAGAGSAVLSGSLDSDGGMHGRHGPVASIGHLADIVLLTLTSPPERACLRMGAYAAAAALRSLTTLGVWSCCAGGSVSVRAVKTVAAGPKPDEAREMRDAWWSEVRAEVRAHARALGCNAMLGYSESAAIRGDICVLSATGTAAAFRPSQQVRVSAGCVVRGPHAPQEGRSCEWAHAPSLRSRAAAGAGAATKRFMCGVCGGRMVPELFLGTVEPPPALQRHSGLLIEARVVRVRRRGTGEYGAASVSDQLPFIEYACALGALVRVQGGESDGARRQVRAASATGSQTAAARPQRAFCHAHNTGGGRQCYRCHRTGHRGAPRCCVRRTTDRIAVPRKRASVAAAGRHPHAGRRSGGSARACAPRARVRRDEGTPSRPVRSVCSLPMGPQALQHEQESPRVSRSFTPPAGAAGDDDDDESVSPARVRACV